MLSNSSVGYLAIDAGTHAVRAALFFNGEMGEIFSESISLIKTPEGFIEQNAEPMAAALMRVCQQAIVSAKGRPLVATLAVQRSSVLMWDRHTAKPLSTVLSWQDTRGHLQLAALNAQTQARIVALTGLQPSAHYGATKLGWLMRNLSVEPDQSPVMGPLACWLASQLTGTASQLTGTNNVYLCDQVNAARTQLLNRHSLQWDAELCELFGIDAAQLPLPVASEAEYGNLCFDGAPAIPLVAVLGDQNAAYIALRYGEAAASFALPLVVNIGSGAFVLGEAQAGVQTDAHTDSMGLLNSLAFSRDTQQLWLCEATVNAAGTTITRWLAQLNGQLSEADLFNQLPQWLNDDVHTSALAVDTQVGLGSPFWRRYKLEQGVIFVDEQGQLLVPTLAVQAVAVIESIVFLLAINILQMQKMATYDGLIVAGGLARVTGLVERLAQLTQLPYRVASCHEATLQGAAVMASGFGFKPQDRGENCSPKIQNLALQARFERYIVCLRTLAT